MKLPWNRPVLPSPPPTDVALEARVRALEERLAHISADSGLLRVEWSEVLDKISHWASRQSGRERKAVKERLDALAAAQEPAGDTNGHQADIHPAPLSKAQLRALVRARGGVQR